MQIEVSDKLHGGTPDCRTRAGASPESAGNESFVADSTLIYSLGEVETIGAVGVQSGTEVMTPEET